MAERIETTADLAALPATTLLESTRPGYGPTYVLVYDAGDGAAMYHAIGGDDLGWLTASEVIDQLGPLDVVGPDRDVVAEVRRLTAERDSLARWKAEALPVMAAFLDLAKRVVPGPALGRPWSDILAEHVDRQAAALREAEAEVARLSGPHRCCPCCADDPVHDVEPDQHTIECSWCGPGAARAALREVAAVLHPDWSRGRVLPCMVGAEDQARVGALRAILARHSGGESDG